jgi:polysaccharide export outer membrane protein
MKAIQTSDRRTRLKCPVPFMVKKRLSFWPVLVFIAAVVVSGCNDKFWDPTQAGRFRPKPTVNVILDNLGVEEEAPTAWEGAEEPRPIDMIVLDTDYVLSAGDIVRVSIFELLQEGTLFTNDYAITETGKISIPEVGVIQAAGLTESQLEGEIKNVLSPGILRDPSVTAVLMQSQRRAFSILGNGIGSPGRYFIPRYGFRLSDALATAAGIGEFNVSYIYVARAVSGTEVQAAPRKPGTGEPAKPKDELTVPRDEMLEIIRPQSKAHRSELVVSSAELGAGDGTNGPVLPKELLQSLRESVDVGPVKPAAPDKGGQVEWIFQNGRWIPVQTGQPVPQTPVKVIGPEKKASPLEEKVPTDYGWEEIGAGGVQARVIKIPIDRFQSGDPRYNVVIRPGDTIYVPVDIVGEFYVTGNVNRQGPITLTGRPITLKMAVATAGGFGPLAWPKRCEVIRRLGKDREEIVMVDMDKIYSGEQPDFFVKVNDLINVGTHPTSRWREALRNSFRATYGFGFVYDRNFADRDVYTGRPFDIIF